ncbi:MAG: phage major capsid protein [Actinomycetota bacterium]|nr:phage major capsid protein [Actinomycetota bacterium]
MVSPNLSEIITTTLRNRTGKLADSVTDNNAILFRLKQKGRIKPVSGGRTIVQELEYAENGTFVWYSGYETLNVATSDVFTAAEFDWKQAAVAVTISGLEQLQNAGDNRVIDLLESRISNAEKTMANQIALGMYADGTGSGSKEMGGLQLLVADSPSTGTVGGINRATYSFWRNFSYDATTDGGAAATSANMQSYMNRVYLAVSRGRDHPDLIVADNAYYRLYLESLQTIQRVTNTELASAGFDNLKYMGADVVYDGGVGGNCPAKHMYFLNTGYLHYRPHSERNMAPIGGERMNVNQDAIVKLIGWAGNMTLSNGSLQGVLQD